MAIAGRCHFPLAGRLLVVEEAKVSRLAVDVMELSALTGVGRGGWAEMQSNRLMHALIVPHPASAAPEQSPLFFLSRLPDPPEPVADVVIRNLAAGTTYVGLGWWLMAVEGW